MGDRRRQGGLAPLALVTGLLLASAASPEERPREALAPIDADEATSRSGFRVLFDEILAPSCSFAFCHGAEAKLGGLDLSEWTRAYDSLLRVPASGPACAESGLVRVAPGKPEMSLLFTKLTLEPPCGVSMPSFDALLSPAERLRIREWIERGAKRD